MDSKTLIATLMEGPGLKPPAGVVPNFVNPYSRQDYGFFELGLCLGLSTVLIGVGAYTKLAIMKSVGREDYVLFLTWLLFIVYCTLGFLAMQYGGGAHQWDVRLADVVKFGQFANAVEVLACFLNLILKIAILLQYLRLFVPTRNRIYYLVYFFMWFNGLFDVAVALVFIFQCKPRRKIWMGDLVPGECVNLGATLISAGIINAFTDFLVLGLPIFTVWRLLLPIKKKVGISAIFALGLFGCVSSVMRLVASVKIAHSKDLTYNLFFVYDWTVAEVASGILCAYLPILPRFLRYFKQSENIIPTSHRPTTGAIVCPPPVPALYQVPRFSATRLHQGELAHEYPKIHQEVVLG